MDFKTGKLIEIVREFLGNNRNRFEINGVEISRAVFMWRKKETKFEPIPKGNYRIITENNATYLQVDDEIKNKAYEYQIIYNNVLESSTYDEDFPELEVLVEKYNLLVKDIGKIKNLLTTTGVKVDTVKMSQILTPLEPNTIWGADENGVIQNFPIGNLNEKYNSMIKNVRDEISNNYTEAIKIINLNMETKEAELIKLKNLLEENITDFSQNQKDEILDKTNELIGKIGLLGNEIQNSIETSVNEYVKNNRELLKGDKGEKGDSNYELWLSQGNNGTIEDFLNTEKEIVKITAKEYLKDNKEFFKGEKGDNNYELWLKQGNTGTVEDFLNEQKKALIDNEVKATSGISVDIGNLSNLSNYQFLYNLHKRGAGKNNVTQGFCEAGIGEIYTLHVTNELGVLNLFTGISSSQDSVAYSEKSEMLGHQQLNTFIDDKGERWFITSANERERNFGAKVVVFQIRRDGETLIPYNFKHWQLFSDDNLDNNTTPTVSKNGEFLLVEVSNYEKATIRIFDLLSLKNKGAGNYSDDCLHEFDISISGRDFPLQSMACDGSAIYVFLGYGKSRNAPIKLQIYSMMGKFLKTVDIEVGKKAALKDGSGNKWEVEGTSWISMNGQKKLAVNIASEGNNRIWVFNSSGINSGLGLGEAPAFLSLGKNDFAVPKGEAMRFGNWDGQNFKESFVINSKGELTPLYEAKVIFVDEDNRESTTAVEVDCTLIANVAFINISFENINTQSLKNGNAYLKLIGIPTPKKRTALAIHSHKSKITRQLTAVIDTDDKIRIMEIVGDGKSSYIVNVEELTGANINISGTYFIRT